MKKKIGILLMACFMLGSSVTSVSAANIQPRGMCLNCDLLMRSFCNKDYRLYDYGTHKPLFKDPCYAKYYDCYGGYKCANCGHVNESEVGRHACREKHESCGLGTYDICTFNGGVLP